jgi:hypothetical protein
MASVSESARSALAMLLAFASLVYTGSATASAQANRAPSNSPKVQPSVNGRLKTTIRYGTDFFANKNPKTAFDMVNLLPGFTFSPGDVSIRGYAAAAGNVLIDGERVSDKQFTLDTVLQHIPADQVDYIEVIEGGRPGLEMLGQTVVANVVRKKSADNTTVASLSNGFFLDGRNTPSGTLEVTRHGTGGRNFSGAVSASQYVELAEGDGPQVRRDSAKNVLDRISVDSTAGGLNAYTYGVFSTPAWKGQLSINGSLSRTDYVYREEDNTTFPAASSSHLHESLGGPLGGQLVGEVGAHFNRSFGEKLTSESVALVDLKGQSYSSHFEAPGVDEQFSEHEHSGEALARTNLRYAATTNITAEISAEGTYNWLYTVNSFFYNSSPTPLPNARATVSEIRDQISGNVIWSIRKTIELELGAKLEDSTIASDADSHQSKTLNYLKPRIALSLTPNSSDHFRFRAEHEVSQLDFTNFVASSSLDTGSVRSGNTNIVPQQDWTFEGAYERHFWSEGDLVFTYRHFLIADAIDRVPVYSPSNSASVFDAPGNIGAGSEDTAIASLTLPLDHLGIDHGQLRLSATRQWSRVTDPTTGASRPITDVNPLEYSIDFRHDLPRWRADWGASFLTPCSKSSTIKGCSKSEYRFNEIDRFRATPTINIFAEYQPWKGTSFRIEADNVLQQRYNRVVNIYAGARNAFPLSYVDNRSLTSSASVLVSLRKTF